MLNRMEGMDFIKKSLETNLFFLRIMKEHLYFASAAFTLKNVRLLPMIMSLINDYDELLLNTIALSGGIIDQETLQAGDIITPYTLRAEMKTMQYAGLPINTDITNIEAAMMNKNETTMNNSRIEESVYMLNQNIINLLRETIRLQGQIMDNVMSCNMFSFVFPTMLHHVTEEAKHYLEHLLKIQNNQDQMNEEDKAMHLEFWNDKMKEHADFLHSFIDHNDPLFPATHEFSNEFNELTNAAKEAMNNVLLVPQVTQESLEATTEIRDYKVNVAMNSLMCQLKSIMLPLFADHILREANHYLKSLKEFSTMNGANQSIKYYG